MAFAIAAKGLNRKKPSTIALYKKFQAGHFSFD
jgi:hypothetical protein